MRSNGPRPTRTSAPARRWAQEAGRVASRDHRGMSHDASLHAVVPISDFTSMQGHPTTRYWKIAGRSLEDRHHGSGAAVLSGPAPLLEPAHDHDPAALGEGLAGVLGLVPPDDHGEERRLPLPPVRHRHVVLPSCCRAVCPALGPGGRWTPWHATRPEGQGGRANQVGPTGSGGRSVVGWGAGWLAGALAAGVGHASTVRPDPSTRRGGSTRLPPWSPSTVIALISPTPGQCGIADLGYSGG